MLIYNHKQEFIGIDEKDLKTLGFKNLAELQNECSDFADLFVKKPNYIHNFKNFNWIYYILHSDIHEAKVIINVNKRNFSATLDLEVIYLSDAPDQPAYAITLSKLRALSGGEVKGAEEDLTDIPTPKAIIPEMAIEEEEGLPDLEDTQPIELSEPDVFETPMQDKVIEDPYDFDFNAPLDIEDIYMPSDEVQHDVTPHEEAQDNFEFENMNDLESPIDIYDHNALEEEAPVEKKPIEKPMLGDYTVASNEYIDNLQVSKDYVYDPHVASDELGLPVDLIEEFIGDFIQQAYDFKDELYNHITDHDFDGVKLLSHKLKGVAANLRIEDAFEVLSIINSSDNMDEVKANLDHFYRIIAKLEGKEVPTIVPATTPSVEEVVPEEEETFLEPKIEDITEEMTEDIELKNDQMIEEEESEEFIEPKEEKQEENPENHIDLKDDDLLHEQDFNEPSDIDEDDIYNVGIKYHDDEPITLENHELQTDESDLSELNKLSDEYDFEEKLDLKEDEPEELETFDFNEEEPLSLDEFTLPDEDELALDDKLSAFETDTSDEIDDDFLTEEPTKEDVSVQDTLDYDKTMTVNELGFGEDLVNQLLSDFKEQANEMNDKLETAVDSNDYVALKNLAISIKGASDNLRLSKISKVLEEMTSVYDEEKARQLLASFKNYINQI